MDTLRVILIVACLVPTLANAGRAQGPGSAGIADAGTLRFSFQAGQSLLYRFGQQDPPMEGAARLSGTITLRTLAITQANAKLRVTCQATGAIYSGGRWTPLSQSPMPPIVALVKLDGTIAGLQDEQGQALTLGGLFRLMLGKDGTNAAAPGLSVSLGSYRLFGLQLPPRLPPAGQTYPGFTYSVRMHTSSTGGKITETESLAQRPATFTYAGPSSVGGRKCLDFLCPLATLPGQPEGEAVRVCFDAARGQVVKATRGGMSVQLGSQSPAGR